MVMPAWIEQQRNGKLIELTHWKQLQKKGEPKRKSLHKLKAQNKINETGKKKGKGAGRTKNRRKM